MSVIDLDGKRIIVTGASSGIGRAAAAQMAASGARVLLVARREKELNQTVDEIRAASGTAEFCVADVRRRPETQAYIDKARELWGGIDGVFANAGAVAAFLMSDAASYVNGQCWSVDGGILGAFINGA